MLTSVPVELVFNDLRDAAKRFSKQELTTASNMHSVVSRSCDARIKEVGALNPEGADWCKPLSGKTVKRQVFDSSRASDTSVGVNTSGLTRKKADGDLTKPHILSYRLQLLRVLHQCWLEEPNSDSFSAEYTFKKLWKSSLLDTGLLMRFEENDKRILMVLVSGPFCVSCLELDFIEHENAVTILQPSKCDVVEIPLLDLKVVKVALSNPKPLMGCKLLGWSLQTEWIDIPHYVANHGIWTISGSLLMALCSDIGLKGHSKLDHKRRAELFMKHLNCSEEHIAEVLAFLPEKVSRKPKMKEDKGGKDTT